MTVRHIMDMANLFSRLNNVILGDSTFQDGHTDTTSHPVMCDLLCLDVSLARDAIVSLILHCIVPDQEVFFKSLADENWILGVLVLLFILLGSLTVMKLGSCTKLDSFGQHTVGANR